MQSLTDLRPKPLIMFEGRCLIDHALDRLAEISVPDAVVNIHYLGGMILEHLSGRNSPKITFSDERDRLLETGGALLKASPLLGREPFFLLNADSVWTEGAGGSALLRLAQAFDAGRMDMLLLLSSQDRAVGYDGGGDFIFLDDGRLRRAAKGEEGALIYMGVAILHPRLLEFTPEDACFSMNFLFEKMLTQRRLFGCQHDGSYLHIGTEKALSTAEALFQTSEPAGRV